MKNSKQLFAFILLFIIVGCKKKEIGPQCPSCSSNEVTSKSNDILIGCEGNFGWGNASLSVLNLNEKTISNQAFLSKNGFAIGDVLQDISFNPFDQNYYMVVNNSGKIIVIDTNYNYLNTITGFTSPRYIEFINSSKAYVSDLYANALSAVNLDSKTIQNTIPINGWTEKMYTTDSITWVTVEDTNQIIRINNVTDQIIDTLIVSKGPNSLIYSNQSIWVLCDGGLLTDTAALYQFDMNGSVLKQLQFDTEQDNPTCLTIDSTGVLYYLNGGVFKFNQSDNTLPTSSLISETNVFYNLAISPTNQLLITDAIDYVQPGKLYIYSPQGVLTDTFTTGIIPQDISFRP